MHLVTHATLLCVSMFSPKLGILTQREMVYFVCVISPHFLPVLYYSQHSLRMSILVRIDSLLWKDVDKIYQLLY